jgi:hypothetical protein
VNIFSNVATLASAEKDQLDLLVRSTGVYSHRRWRRTQNGGWLGRRRRDLNSGRTVPERLQTASFMLLSVEERTRAFRGHNQNH